MPVLEFFKYLIWFAKYWQIHQRTWSVLLLLYTIHVDSFQELRFAALRLIIIKLTSIKEILRGIHNANPFYPFYSPPPASHNFPHEIVNFSSNNEFIQFQCNHVPGRPILSICPSILSIRPSILSIYLIYVQEFVYHSSYVTWTLGTSLGMYFHLVSAKSNRLVAQLITI